VTSVDDEVEDEDEFNEEDEFEDELDDDDEETARANTPPTRGST
jgi:hypothetical protein